MAGPWYWPASENEPHPRVVEVYDGDTLWADLTRDIGFHGLTTFRQKLRIAGVQAPELDEHPTEAELSKAFVIAETIGRDDLTMITIKPYKYGDEWMVVVLFPDGQSLAERLVAARLAVRWNGRGPRPSGLPT